MQYGEDLDVPVVVDRGLPVRVQVERVDHVAVAEVGGGRLVRYVDGMVQREVPDGEGLELGVSGLPAEPVLVVELGQAHGHLTAAGAGGGDDHQRLGGLHELVPAVPLVGDDKRDVRRVAGDGVVPVDLQAQGLGLLLEGVRGGLPVVLGDDQPAHAYSPVVEGVHEPEDLLVVADADVLADLVPDDVLSVDDDDRLGLAAELHQHAYLAVRHEPGKDPGCVVVVEKLASELQVELSTGALDALPDVL